MTRPPDISDTRPRFKRNKKTFVPSNTRTVLAALQAIARQDRRAFQKLGPVWVELNYPDGARSIRITEGKDISRETSTEIGPVVRGRLGYFERRAFIGHFVKESKASGTIINHFAGSIAYFSERNHFLALDHQQLLEHLVIPEA